MKNPLVDALRQATEARSLENTGDALVVDDMKQDDLQTANEDYRGAETEPQAEPEDHQELELLEATGALVVSETKEPDNDDTADASADADETMLVAALPDDAALTVDHHSINQQLYRTTHAEERPTLLAEAVLRQSAVTRAGQWSPVLCIVLAFVAAGCWWALQSIGGVYTNSDLRSLPGQAFDSRSELAEFGLGASPFPLIVSGEAAAAQIGGDEQ